MKHPQTGTISVRRYDIFISAIGLPLASGYLLPAGTAFVCRRGGHRSEMVFQHPSSGELSMVVMPKKRIADEMQRGLRQQLPIRLAAAFRFPVDHIQRTRPIPGRHYALRLPMPALDGGTWQVGTVVRYQPMNGLHVFSVVGVYSNGYPARLVLGDEDLRAMSPCAAPQEGPVNPLLAA